MPEAAVLRYSAFPDGPGGGNPAGVVLDARGLDADAMQAIAADVGFSETAFVVARAERGQYDVRYFSPLAEVPFCGHATIATGVALADRDGPGVILVHCPAGEVPVATASTDGVTTATLTSVEPSTSPADPALVAVVMRALGWAADELDPSLPAHVAFAGARHLVLAAARRERLADLDYAFVALRELMEGADLTTVALLWREAPLVFHTRNPFPVGGVVEDPATGAAAAAVGGYLRALGVVPETARLTVLQGVDMGRPSRLLVDLTAGDPRVRVTGTAVML
jgi:PhzF family phenazine biosynthesis protein